MTKAIYIGALAMIAAGMLFVHEGRTAKDKKELDWMAEKVYKVEPETLFEWHREYESGGVQPESPEAAEPIGIDARRDELMKLGIKRLAALCKEKGLPPVRPGMSKDSVVEAILEQEYPAEEETDEEES